MLRKSRYCVALISFIASLLILSAGGTALGWSGFEHADMCMGVFTDPGVEHLVNEMNFTIAEYNSIVTWWGEPPDEWHDGQWVTINTRAYIDTAGDMFDGKNWNTLSEVDRLRYLMHTAGDVAVPIGHSPAHYNPGGFSGDFEATFELMSFAYWQDPPGPYAMPHIYYSSVFTNWQTWKNFYFDGTINDIKETFYEACRDNMTWLKEKYENDTLTNDDVIMAAWNGKYIAKMLMRAVLADYLLAKKKPVVEASEEYSGPPWGPATMKFYCDGSYDPDDICWDRDGKYEQMYDTLVRYEWDFNRDGIWDWGSDTPYCSHPVVNLLGLGCPEGLSYYDVRCLDDEGKWSDIRTEQMYIGPAPEPACLSLLAVGGLTLLRRRRNR